MDQLSIDDRLCMPGSTPSTAAHARVEDRIRTGLGRLPSRILAIDAAWLTAAMIAVDLLVLAQTLLLHDTAHARIEPKALWSPPVPSA